MNRGVIVVAGVLVLLGAVAMTAGMARPAAEAAQGVTVSAGVLLTYGAVVAVVAGVALAVFGPFWSGREKWTGFVLALLLLLGFAILAERSHPQTQPQAQQQRAAASPAPQQQPTPAPSQSQVIPPAATPGQPSPRGSAALAAWTIAVIGSGALLIALLVLRYSGRNAGGAGPPRRAAVALDDTLALSMADVAAETDPRRAVVAAWISMGDTLARHGLRRMPHEAALEYMRRALRAVQVSAPSVERLTALFQRARYSDHPATAAMRDEALAALQSVRDDLRDEEAPS